MIMTNSRPFRKVSKFLPQIILSVLLLFSLPSFLWMILGAYLGLNEQERAKREGPLLEEAYQIRRQTYLSEQKQLVISNISALDVKQVLTNNWNLKFDTPYSQADLNKISFQGSYNNEIITFVCSMTSIIQNPYYVIDTNFDVITKDSLSDSAKLVAEHQTLKFFIDCVSIGNSESNQHKLAFWITETLPSLKNGESKELSIESVNYTLSYLVHAPTGETIHSKRLRIKKNNTDFIIRL